MPTTTARRARAIPIVPWSALGRWRPRPSSTVVLAIGLWLFGTGEAMIVAARLGNTPWTVLGEGIARHLSLSIGTVTILVSGVVLLGWIPLRERPGLGTVVNAIEIGIALDVMGKVLPRPDVVVGRLALGVGGVAVIAGGAALYLSTHLGPGPRDGLMTGLAHRLDRPIARIRLVIETTVLIAGVALGGRVGVVTVLFALTIGHALAVTLAALTRLVAPTIVDDGERRPGEP
jgi:uncharacterized protein